MNKSKGSDMAQIKLDKIKIGMSVIT